MTAKRRYGEWKRPTTEWARRLDAARYDIVRATWIQHHGNRTQTARALGLTRGHVSRLIRELEITRYDTD